MKSFISLEALFPKRSFVIVEWRVRHAVAGDSCQFHAPCNVLQVFGLQTTFGAIVNRAFEHRFPTREVWLRSAARFGNGRVLEEQLVPNEFGLPGLGECQNLSLRRIKVPERFGYEIMIDEQVVDAPQEQLHQKPDRRGGCEHRESASMRLLWSPWTPVRTSRIKTLSFSVNANHSAASLATKMFS